MMPKKLVKMIALAQGKKNNQNNQTLNVQREITD